MPGGQAVQRADDTAAVRNGTIVFCCDGTARAAVTASWYRQMGFPNVYAVAGGTAAWAAAGQPLASGADETAEPVVAEASAPGARVSPAELARGSRRPRPGAAPRRPERSLRRGSHPRRAVGAAGWLELRIAEVAPDARRRSSSPTRTATSRAAAATLLDLGYRTWPRSPAAGGVAQAGRPVEQGLTGVMRPPDDIVPAGPIGATPT